MPTDRFDRLILGTNLSGTDGGDGSLTIDVAGGSGLTPYAKVTKSANQSIGDNAWTTVTWNTEITDPDGMHDNSSNTNRLTVPTGDDGTYVFVCVANFSGNATGVRGVEILKNSVTAGTGVLNLATSPGLTGIAAAVCCFAMVPLVATDWVSVVVYQNSTGALDLLGDSSTVGSSFQVWRIA